MDTKETLLAHLHTIEDWEQDQKSLWFWEKLGRIPFKLLDKLTPSFIQEKIGFIISELGNFVQSGGKYLINEAAMIDKISVVSSSPVHTIEEIGNIPLEDMIALSENMQKERVKLATIQGASTGIGGLFTLVVDIPIILGIALKTLQEIAIIHGYNPNDKQERIFIIKCLQFASSDIVGKEAILKEISSMHDNNQTSQDMIAQLKGWQEVFLTYREHFGWKKLLQTIPIAGILFGAYANRSMIQDISESAMMLYRKRRIYDKLEKM